jgi:ATP-dependent DNA helicase RecG
MDGKHLRDLLKDLESDRIERKSSITERDKIRQAVCAFANDLPNHRKPGVIFIGANDDGSCANLTITDELLRILADIRSDGNILPFPTMTVQKKKIDGCDLAVVIVEPSDSPPVRYKGRVWIRVGPRRAIATQEEERRLTEKRRAKDLPFDIHPVPSAIVDDLDFDLFNQVYLPSALSTEIIGENQRPIGQQLTSLRFVAIEPPSIPTVLGILVVGKDPRRFLPGAYIQFLRIDGMDLTDPINDQKEISGPLPDQLKILDETLQINITTALDFTSKNVETRRPDYPIVALQQLARNAVLHRIYEGTHAPVRIYWFSDRIEILSPGGAFGQVNKGNFGHPGTTDYRNPHLAEAMKNLGYVQRFGIGIQIARKELEKNGNPEPEFIVEDSFVLAIARRRT